MSNKGFWLPIVLTWAVMAGAIVAEHTFLPDESVYKIRGTDKGEAYIHCLNGADATVRPTDEFGSIIVSCGK